MTAASLAYRLGRLGVSITLVESSAVGTVGVGEATVPAIRRYFQSLGMDPFEVLKATNGTIKLAIEFEGWRQEGHSFMHPFGRFGLEAGPVAFHHLWNRLRLQGDPGTLDDYAMGAQLARAGRVTLPPDNPRVDFEHFVQARLCAEAHDQAAILQPRLGYCGVIDERLDLGLIDAIATARPEWHLIFLGPVTKVDPATLQLPGDEPWIYAIFAAMELSIDAATATVLTVADGTVSLYLSTGGGVIGAGDHAAVREAAQRFRHLVAESRDLFRQTAEFPLPKSGEVRFHARIGGAWLTAAASEAALRARRDPLAELYAAGQDVLTEIRLASS